MARYFFHKTNGSRSADTIGTELPDVRAARIEAIRLAGAMLNDTPHMLDDDPRFRIEVADQQDDVLCEVIVSWRMRDAE